MRIKLLRHGNPHTGGTRFEEDLLKGLQEAFAARGISAVKEKKVLPAIIKGWRNFWLLSWGYWHSNADINIVVARLALPAIWRARTSGGKNLIVLHYFDHRDNKSRLLKFYYSQLFKAIRKASPGSLAIITVSPWFHTLFRRLFPQQAVFLIPNLFDNRIYEGFSGLGKEDKKIFLGQWSFKNDARIFDLARELSSAGYHCFFCTLYPEEIKSTAHYVVKHMSFEVYLQEMATSCCTISFTGINEGWSRLTHESLLVGTPVIGLQKGGLGNLLKESGSYIVKNVQEALQLVKGHRLQIPQTSFFKKKYAKDKMPEYIAPLINFLQSK